MSQIILEKTFFTSCGDTRCVSASLSQQADVGNDCSQPADLKVKSEFKTEPSSPQQSPAEDQTEPVDLSLNKPRPASTTSIAANPSPSSVVTGLSATPVPSAVQSIGSMVTTNSHHPWYTPPLVPVLSYTPISSPPGPLSRIHLGHTGCRRPADPPCDPHHPIGQHAQQGGPAADHSRGCAVAPRRLHHHAY